MKFGSLARKQIAILIILSMTVSLIGCVTVSSASQQETLKALNLQPAENAALVYVMAPQTGGFIFTVFINGKKIGKLKDQHFLYVMAKPGSLELATESQFPIFVDSKTIFSVEAGQTYYILARYHNARNVDEPSARRVLTEHYSLKGGFMPGVTIESIDSVASIE